MMRCLKSQLIFLCSLVVFCSGITGEASAQAPQNARNGGLDIEQVRKQVTQLRKVDAQAAAQQLDNALEKITEPKVAAEFFTLLGEVYTVDLKAPDQALAVFERALPLLQKDNKVPAPYWLGLIRGQALALLGAQKAAEAEAVLQDNWPFLVEAAQSFDLPAQVAVRETLRTYREVLKATNDKNAQQADTKQAEIMARFLSEAPLYIYMASFDPGSPVMGEAISALLKAGKPEEALSWAKLSYQVCRFTKEDIERATQNLNKVWGHQENFGTVRQFLKAQGDATEANPLSQVKSPSLSPTTQANLKKWLVDLQRQQAQAVDPNRARDIVKWHILLGTPQNLKEAMQAAMTLLKERPDLQEGSLLVCRVFKAADLNLIRANAFLTYLEGEGANPVPEFLKDNARPIKE